MSLQTLKVNELKELADEYAVDISSVKTKAQIIEELEASGVTASYVGIEAIEPPQPVDPNQRTYVIKMDRSNFMYEVPTPTTMFVFTREHPFAVATEDEANIILDIEGFRIASPKEAKEYYG